MLNVRSGSEADFRHTTDFVRLVPIADIQDLCSLLFDYTLKSFLCRDAAEERSGSAFP
jgi:hypothetical protein